MANKFATAMNTTKPQEAVEPAMAAPAAKPAAEAKVTASPHERPARRNTKHIGGYFDPVVSRQLRTIAVEEDSSLQDLLGEAIDMLFHSRQQPPIAHKPVGG